jgi:predicted lipoprotein with Yx(FWY)xxD motif
MPQSLLRTAIVAFVLGGGALAHGQDLPAPDELITHPAEVALMDEGARGFVFRRFTSGQRLYVSDLDPPGRSNCYEGCASAWPPLVAPPGAKPLGQWTVISRRDGRLQWAFQGRPVYTLFHDSPSDPGGNGIDGVWRIIDYSAAPHERSAAASGARSAGDAATSASATVESLPPTPPR